MAKAESILDLIDVKFQDATNHVSFVSDDIMGLVMPYYWGESDKVSVHNKTTFYEMYPESLPIGVKSLTNNDRDIYSGYAQVKAYFAHGGGQVEVYRPSKGFKYQRISLGASVSGSISFEQNVKQFDEESNVCIALKHAGFVPQSLASGFDNIAVGVKGKTIEGYDGNAIEINVYGVSYNAVKPAAGDVPSEEGWYELVNGKYVLSEDDTVDTSKTYYEKKVAVSENLLETFEGATNPLANISGESIYLEDVVSSEFIAIRVNGDSVIGETELIAECAPYDNGASGNVAFDKDLVDGVKDACKYFRDFEVSNATLVINPFVKKDYTIGSGQSAQTIDCQSGVDTELASLVEYRKNVMAVFGYPIDEKDSNNEYSAEGIADYFANHVGKGYKFCIALQGREIITLFGYRYTLNCVAGYCGKMINVAKEAHLNQIASGYIYGTYGGSLKESLLSGDVIDLMELGINSVYTSKRGNIIFGTRTMYSKQSSYFGKTNVMRVCSAILKNIYPIAVETLHTDAASNPITRASLSTMLNSVLGTFIENQDLYPDSVADCSDSINTDYLTKGGTVLNIILRLHFIGLVERVSIKIIATDTSVTAEFV